MSRLERKLTEAKGRIERGEVDYLEVDPLLDRNLQVVKRAARMRLAKRGRGSITWKQDVEGRFRERAALQAGLDVIGAGLKQASSEE